MLLSNQLVFVAKAEEEAEAEVGRIEVGTEEGDILEPDRHP